MTTHCQICLNIYHTGRAHCPVCGTVKVVENTRIGVTFTEKIIAVAYGCEPVMPHMDAQRKTKNIRKYMIGD